MGHLSKHRYFTERWFYVFWLCLIGGFAVLHALHLNADFPNHSPWIEDWAKYTDEGWYGNAAIRAHLFGSWYLPGDFNPALAVPVWPFLEWLLFFVTGVSVTAARGLAVGLFFVNLLLVYLLLRDRVPRWAALLALSLAATSPFLYCFSRLAILEPLLTALTLLALNIIVRIPRLRDPVPASIGVGVIFGLMLLTKTTASFFLPGMLWAILIPLRRHMKIAVKCSLAALGGLVVTYGAWIGCVIRAGLFKDFTYFFFVNHYSKPPEFYWPVESLWWSFHGGLWVDRILFPLAALVVMAVLLTWRGVWGLSLLKDPVFGASLWIITGSVLFMTAQNHPQPRYFAVVAYFSFIVVAQGAASLLPELTARSPEAMRPYLLAHIPGAGLLILALSAVGTNAAWTLNYALHPQYTFVNAAHGLVNYIDSHPNGNRRLLSISGDELTLISQVPSLCDDFGTEDLAPKLARYQPGWFATWNDIDPGTLEDLHSLYSLEQVAEFPAMDHPERNRLVLFKLRPLADGRAQELDPEMMRQAMPEDKIGIPLE